MASDRPPGSQVGLAREFVRVPLLALLLSVAVGGLNGLMFGVVVLGPAAASSDVTVGDILVGAPGYGAMAGIALSPLGLLMATAAVVAVRRGRGVRAVVAVVTSVTLVVVAGFWLAVGYDFVPNELETPWLFILAAVGGCAVAVGFVRVTVTGVLRRSSSHGADQELPAVGTGQ